MSGDALLAEVYANPTSDDARSVYADWLLARGDPRGTFIQLQLKASPTPADLALADRLLKASGRAWLGDAGRLIRKHDLASVRFTRGFLSHARLEVRDGGAVHDPVLSTLESLDCADAHLLVGPHMRALLSVQALSMVGFAGMVELPFELAIERASAEVSFVSPSELLARRLATADAPVFRNLTSFACTSYNESAMPWLARSWIPARVTDLQLDHVRVLPAVMRMFEARPQLRTVTLRQPPLTCRLTRPLRLAVTLGSSHAWFYSVLPSLVSRDWTLDLRVSWGGAALLEHIARTCEFATVRLVR